MPNYPDTDGFALSFSRAEIDIGGRLFVAIESISASQALSEGVVFGAAAEPLARTEGQNEIGKGSIEWSSLQEAFEFLKHLKSLPGARGWKRKLFNITSIWTTPDGSESHVVEYRSCRVLDFDESHKQGADAAHATMPFSFMRRLIDGQVDL